MWAMSWRVVIGHSPTGGVVWPRFHGRVVANDTGIAAHYGSHSGVLELTPAGAVAIYGKHRIALPDKNEGRVAYLKAVIEVDANNALLKQRLARLLAPPVESAEEVPAEGAENQDSTGPIPGTCQ